MHLLILGESHFRVLPTNGEGFMALFIEVANLQLDGIFL